MTWYYRFPLTLVTLLLTPVQPNIQDADLTKKKKKKISLCVSTFVYLLGAFDMECTQHKYSQTEYM